MKRIALKYGLISGAIIMGMIGGSLALAMSGKIELQGSEVFGYATMVMAFLTIFLGIRTYREEQAGGTIGFGRAFKVGILIVLVASAFYVVTWEIVYWGFYPDFLVDYQAHMMEKMRAAGASEAAIAAAERENAYFAELYANPLLNAGITFLEIFPVGLIVTLVSAAILRKSARSTAAAVATETA